MSPTSLPNENNDESGSSSSRCKWCQRPIIFLQNPQTKRWLPLLLSNPNEVHQCSQRPEGSMPKHYCQYCNQEIHFDSAVKSFRGKFLPLSKDGTRHWCRENPMARAHRLKKWLRKQGLPSDQNTIDRIMSREVTPDANLSGKDSSEISQAEINKIKQRYEIEEQRQKAVEDLNSTYQQRHTTSEDRNRRPLAVGDTDNGNNNIKGNSTPITPLGNGGANNNNIPGGGTNKNDSSSIFHRQFQHYTERKKQEIRDQARRQLEEQKRKWAEEEQELLSLPDMKRYAGLTYDDVREMFGFVLTDGEQKKRDAIYRALKLFGIPLSEYIWSRENDYKGCDFEGQDYIDQRIAQFPTEQHILQAYRNYIEALRVRDVKVSVEKGQRITVVCPDCLDAAVRARDTLIDAAKKIQYVKWKKQQ